MSDRQPTRSQGRTRRRGGIGGAVIAVFVVGVILLAAVVGFVVWSEGRSLVEQKAAVVEVPLPSLPDAPRLPDTPAVPPVNPPTLPAPGSPPIG